MTVILSGEAGLRAHVGEHLGFSEYVEVTQQRIDLFAEASGDRQWIHIDPVRAAQGPFGKTIAHGLLTLSMIADLAKDLFKFDGFRLGVNYGFDKVRFAAPVPVGARVRLGAKTLSSEPVGDAIQTIMEFAVEVEGADKPACIAHMIFRHYR